ncbi:GNAT family N-acetyltransferase [Bradyrhizobium sp. ISRA443]|uniref:GNAT family N-acetyltransferase n=1 Tax=unclassified Bradyrhizobium TaxID=2631580 RepID=UPI00247B0510|nr:MULTISPECIES: GNAT family N-acetyltransferase [unclassified Bradyrhizobium]WGR97817.1 GNAT family N-acetyltransferase [Bradyrhizobium sp. ISRA436]WGS04706.1 GNAT family N-acetyltransferase [Bradyrhizobium sp. ISRA437]WGS11587.1 GNAT family N-acetyltransferase [Bradyrhizobium sp. ISRA443]
MKAWVTYLEMTDPSKVMRFPAPALPLSITGRRLAVKDYLRLFRLVGDRVQWDLRTKASEAEVAQLISAHDLMTLVLRVSDVARGLCEFRQQSDREVELLFFGIDAQLEGQGLGRYFLSKCLTIAWARQPGRIWLRTDEFDSPKAVKLYASVGFSIFDRRYEDIAD